jgi:hypothetical protein
MKMRVNNNWKSTVISLFRSTKTKESKRVKKVNCPVRENKTKMMRIWSKSTGKMLSK